MMANLKALYEDSGLPGIIPYAFGMEGQGYRYLCAKLREGVKLYILISKSGGMPFYRVNEEKIYFSLYSDKEYAFKQCEKMTQDKFYCGVGELNEKTTASIWKRFRDLGANHMRLDDAVWIKMSDLAHPATYEGMINKDTPLRNPTLNSMMYIIKQYMEADSCGDEFIASFWEHFTSCRFYAPVRRTRKLNVGEMLNTTNSDFHFMQLDDGTMALLIFTDEDFKESYAKLLDMDLDDVRVTYTPFWSDIETYLDENSGMAVCVNYGSDGLILTPQLIQDFEMLALNQKAKNGTLLEEYKEMKGTDANMY